MMHLLSPVPFAWTLKKPGFQEPVVTLGFELKPPTMKTLTRFQKAVGSSVQGPCVARCGASVMRV